MEFTVTITFVGSQFISGSTYQLRWSAELFVDGLSKGAKNYDLNFNVETDSLPDRIKELKNSIVSDANALKATYLDEQAALIVEATEWLNLKVNEEV